MKITKNTTKLSIAVIFAAGAFALSGCSTASEAADTTDSSTVETVAAELTVSDTWVKAADSGMTAAFGMVKNTTDEDRTIVSVKTTASDRAELHEMVKNAAGEMVMQAIEGGVTVPAGGSFMFEPGKNHIMLLNVVDPIAAGDDVTVTLTLDDGSTVEFIATAKDFAGANENYEDPNMEMDEGMDMEKSE